MLYVEWSSIVIPSMKLPVPLRFSGPKNVVQYLYVIYSVPSASQRAGWQKYFWTAAWEESTANHEQGKPGTSQQHEVLSAKVEISEGQSRLPSSFLFILYLGTISNQEVRTDGM